MKQTCLEGVRVVEYGTGVAGRYCAQVLAMLGADVTRLVDLDEGAVPDDPQAQLRAQAERLFLDLHKAVERAEAPEKRYRELLPACDIAIRGVEPGGPDVAERLVAEYHAARSAGTGAILVALTPFGLTGGAAGWHGGDLNAQGVSGWPVGIGFPDRAPLSMGYGVGALQHGQHAAGAAVGALLGRGNEFRGELIDIAAADIYTAQIGGYMGTYELLGIPLVRDGRRAPGNSGRYHVTLPCKDGYVLTIPRTEGHWQRLLEMIGNPEWSRQDRYQDTWAMATEYPEEVDALIGEWLAERGKEEVGELANRFKVPLAPVRTIDEVFDDAQFLHRGTALTVEAEDGRTVRLPGLPARWRRSPIPASEPA